MRKPVLGIWILGDGEDEDENENKSNKEEAWQEGGRCRLVILACRVAQQGVRC